MYILPLMGQQRSLKWGFDSLRLPNCAYRRVLEGYSPSLRFLSRVLGQLAPIRPSDAYEGLEGTRPLQIERYGIETKIGLGVYRLQGSRRGLSEN